MMIHYNSTSDQFSPGEMFLPPEDLRPVKYWVEIYFGDCGAEESVTAGEKEKKKITLTIHNMSTSFPPEPETWTSQCIKGKVRGSGTVCVWRLHADPFNSCQNIQVKKKKKNSASWSNWKNSQTIININEIHPLRTTSICPAVNRSITAETLTSVHSFIHSAKSIMNLFKLK